MCISQCYLNINDYVYLPLGLLIQQYNDTVGHVEAPAAPAAPERHRRSRGGTGGTGLERRPRGR